MADTYETCSEPFIRLNEITLKVLKRQKQSTICVLNGTTATRSLDPIYLAKPTSAYWLIDIETDGLSPTVIWVLCAINIGTGEEVTLTDPTKIREWINVQLANPATVFVGHNILSFDAPVLNRLLGLRIGSSRCVDTYVLSMLYSPSLAGGHSLGAWGLWLGFPKTEFNDWSKLSDDMVRYCLNDCRVNVRLFLRLSERMVSVGFTDRSCEIEHKAWSIIQRQKKNGFQFDVPKAHELYAELRELERKLKDEIYVQWPPTLAFVKRFAKAFKNDGTHSAGYERHRCQYPKLELLDDGGYNAYDFVEFNLGSPKQRIEKLLELGWKPREFTPKGSPQATRKGNLVPSLEEFLIKNPNEAARKLAEWIAINARGNMISGWIDVADDKGLIHGSLWLAGSLRYRHDNPNTANIPAVRVASTDGQVLRGRAGGFTYEARDLWTVRDRTDRRLVGVDAKGIQLRVLAEYLKNDAFTEALLGGDPHEYNRQLAGIDTRAKAKTFIYAFLLGAGDAKIGEILGSTVRHGAEVKNRFINNFPGLKQLLGRLTTELERTGRITLCDGARVLVPSPHAVLGYLLQGDESRIMKQAMITVDGIVRRQKLDAIQVGMIHDELQYDVQNDSAESFKDLLTPSFNEAGLSFGYKVPVDCDYKEGMTWSETH